MVNLISGQRQAFVAPQSRDPEVLFNEAAGISPASASEGHRPWRGIVPGAAAPVKFSPDWKPTARREHIYEAMENAAYNHFCGGAAPAMQFNAESACGQVNCYLCSTQIETPLIAAMLINRINSLGKGYFNEPDNLAQSLMQELATGSDHDNQFTYTANAVHSPERTGEILMVFLVNLPHGLPQWDAPNPRLPTAELRDGKVRFSRDYNGRWFRCPFLLVHYNCLAASIGEKKLQSLYSGRSAFAVAQSDTCSDCQLDPLQAYRWDEAAFLLATSVGPEVPQRKHVRAAFHKALKARLSVYDGGEIRRYDFRRQFNQSGIQRAEKAVMRLDRQTDEHERLYLEHILLACCDKTDGHLSPRTQPFYRWEGDTIAPDPAGALRDVLLRATQSEFAFCAKRSKGHYDRQSEVIRRNSLGCLIAVADDDPSSLVNVPFFQDVRRSHCADLQVRSLMAAIAHFGERAGEASAGALWLSSPYWEPPSSGHLSLHNLPSSRVVALLRNLLTGCQYHAHDLSSAWHEAAALPTFDYTAIPARVAADLQCEYGLPGLHTAFGDYPGVDESNSKCDKLPQAEIALALLSRIWHLMRHEERHETLQLVRRLSHLAVQHSLKQSAGSLVDAEEGLDIVFGQSSGTRAAAQRVYDQSTSRARKRIRRFLTFHFRMGLGQEFLRARVQGFALAAQTLREVLRQFNNCRNPKELAQLLAPKILHARSKPLPPHLRYSKEDLPNVEVQRTVWESGQGVAGGGWGRSRVETVALERNHRRRVSWDGHEPAECEPLPPTDKEMRLARHSKFGQSYVYGETSAADCHYDSSLKRLIPTNDLLARANKNPHWTPKGYYRTGGNLHEKPNSFDAFEVADVNKPRIYVRPLTRKQDDRFDRLCPWVLEPWRTRSHYPPRMGADGQPLPPNRRPFRKYDSCGTGEDGIQSFSCIELSGKDRGDPEDAICRMHIAEDLDVKEFRDDSKTPPTVRVSFVATGRDVLKFPTSMIRKSQIAEDMAEHRCSKEVWALIVNRCDRRGIAVAHSQPKMVGGRCELSDRNASVLKSLAQSFLRVDALVQPLVLQRLPEHIDAKHNWRFLGGFANAQRGRRGDRSPWGHDDFMCRCLDPYCQMACERNCQHEHDHQPAYRRLFESPGCTKTQYGSYAAEGGTGGARSQDYPEMSDRRHAFDTNADPRGRPEAWETCKFFPICLYRDLVERFQVVLPRLPTKLNDRQVEYVKKAVNILDMGEKMQPHGEWAGNQKRNRVPRISEGNGRCSKRGSSGPTSGRYCDESARPPGSPSSARYRPHAVQQLPRQPHRLNSGVSPGTCAEPVRDLTWNQLQIRAAGGAGKGSRPNYERSRRVMQEITARRMRNRDMRDAVRNAGVESPRTMDVQCQRLWKAAARPEKVQPRELMPDFDERLHAARSKASAAMYGCRMEQRRMAPSPDPRYERERRLRQQARAALDTALRRSIVTKKEEDDERAASRASLREPATAAQPGPVMDRCLKCGKTKVAERCDKHPEKSKLFCAGCWTHDEQGCREAKRVKQDAEAQILKTASFRARRQQRQGLKHAHRQQRFGRAETLLPTERRLCQEAHGAFGSMVDTDDPWSSTCSDALRQQQRDESNEVRMEVARARARQVSIDEICAYQLQAEYSVSMMETAAPGERAHAGAAKAAVPDFNSYERRVRWTDLQLPSLPRGDHELPSANASRQQAVPTPQYVEESKAPAEAERLGTYDPDGNFHGPGARFDSQARVRTRSFRRSLRNSLMGKEDLERERSMAAPIFPLLSMPTTAELVGPDEEGPKEWDIPAEEQTRLFNEGTFDYARGIALEESVVQDRCRMCHVTMLRDRRPHNGPNLNNRFKKFCAGCWGDSKPPCEARLRQLRNYEYAKRINAVDHGEPLPSRAGFVRNSFERHRAAQRTALYLERGRRFRLDAYGDDIVVDAQGEPPAGINVGDFVVRDARADMNVGFTSADDADAREKYAAEEGIATLYEPGYGLHDPEEWHPRGTSVLLAYAIVRVLRGDYEEVARQVPMLLDTGSSATMATSWLLKRIRGKDHDTPTDIGLTSIGVNGAAARCGCAAYVEVWCCPNGNPDEGFWLRLPATKKAQPMAHTTNNSAAIDYGILVSNHHQKCLGIDTTSQQFSCERPMPSLPGSAATIEQLAAAAHKPARYAPRQNADGSVPRSYFATWPPNSVPRQYEATRQLLRRDADRSGQGPQTAPKPRSDVSL